VIGILEFLILEFVVIKERNSSGSNLDWQLVSYQRDGMGREEGGGFRMGNTCIPVVDSF